MPNNDYVYLTYKTDKYFHLCERDLQIILSLNELEKSANKEKVSTPEDECLLQLKINYDFGLLEGLVKVVRSSLEGPLGADFYEQRKDFLEQLCFYL